MTEYLDRVLQFVPDGCHEVVIRGSRVNQNSKHSMCTDRRHREQQARLHSGAAVTFRDVHHSVGVIDLIHERTKGL
jgi:hypothetical protein